MSHWTHPYHGVQHMLGLRKGFQITIEDHGCVADCCVLCFHSDKAFTPVAEESFPTVAAAQEWGEQQAALLRIN